jgi:hypothetical protein
MYRTSLPVRDLGNCRPMDSVTFFFTFLLLAYVGNTFGSYGQNNSIQRPEIYVTITEQRHKKKQKIQQENKSLVCPCGGSGEKRLFRPIVRP